MDALSLKGFLLIAAVVGLVATMGISFYRGSVALDEVALNGIGSVMIGLWIAGFCYIVQFVKEFRALHFPTEELLPSEAVIQETPHSVVYYRTGRWYRLWEQMGGKLVLTNQRLVFIAHRGQPSCYRLYMSLEEVARVDGADVIGGFPGELRVTTVGGKQELFTFGAVRKLDAEDWAAAIFLARHRLNPAWGAEWQL